MEIRQTGHAEPTSSLEHPVYRVQFWERPSPEHGWNLDAFVLIGAANVNEVLTWVSENSHGRDWELFLESEAYPIEKGLQIRTAPLIHLAGENPNVAMTR